MPLSDVIGFGSIFGVVLFFVVLLVVYNKRRERQVAAKREGLRPEFHASCRVLGLTEAEDGWWLGERDGVRVGVRWVRYRTFSWVTEYRAILDPPLTTGAVIYGRVEYWGKVHQAYAVHWNHMELPSGGTLNDFYKARDQATVEHTDIELSKDLCVYATDPAVASRVLTGPLKDRILVARDTCPHLFIDDTQVRVLLTAPWGTVCSTWKEDRETDYPQHEQMVIGAALAGMSILARDLQRLAA